MELVVRRIPNWEGTKESTELYHHGIKGQKWGVRRYQNPDGSLTSAGKARYGTENSRLDVLSYQEYKHKTKKKYGSKADTALLISSGAGLVAMGLGGAVGGLPVMAAGAAATLAAPFVQAAINHIGNKRINEAKNTMSDAQKALNDAFEETEREYVKAKISGNKDAEDHYVKRGSAIISTSRLIREGEEAGKRYTVTKSDDGGFSLTSQHYDPKKHNSYVADSGGIRIKKKKTG